MGSRKGHAPRHGSMQYYPRKRARDFVGKFKSWPEIDGPPKILGLAGYKVGMTHVITIENREGSPFYGHERVGAVTILECPPMIVFAVRLFRKSFDGLKCIGEAWAGEFKDELHRLLTLPDDYDSDNSLMRLEEKLDDSADEIRVLIHTQPKLTGIGKKTPEIMEYKVDGGDIKSQWDYVKELIGKEIKVSDIFKEGDYIDVSAVSKGKGFQGVVRRFGIKRKQHKANKTVREVGCIGAWKPNRVMWTVPRAGQMGYHQRVEYNKQILKIGIDPKEITPKGGFLKYGVLRNEYMVIKGSVPGPRKRIIRFRFPIRASEKLLMEPPEIAFVSLESKQGN
ncbi:MAG: 50S ribosomal protein L3 [Candidatus Lokiarchaeota archaeon]|nr:50S ribosomal protein L3 [Candidatus Lokiarchaeota archaeon]